LNPARKFFNLLAQVSENVHFRISLREKLKKASANAIYRRFFVKKSAVRRVCKKVVNVQ
jgi:hypothetical protein